MTFLIQQMGHVAFAVPDPEASARDLRDIVGLTVASRTPDAVFLSSNTRAYEVSYRQGPEARVLAIGLEAVSVEAVAEVRRRAVSDGLAILDDRPLHPGAEAAIRFKGPCGATYEVHTPLPRTAIASGASGPGSRPKRLEHVNLLVPDVAATREFLANTLGLRLSDSAGDNLLSWHRAGDGFHHTVALGPGPGKLHHYAFDLRALEDLAGIADTLASQERAMIWGPGRHGAGGNVFTYYVDRDGCIVENSIEMMRVDQEALYQPNHWEIGPGMSGRWINLWGGGPPADFGEPGMLFA